MNNRLLLLMERSARFLPHCFLLILFFVLHNINENYGLIPTSIIIRFGALYLLIGIALFLLSRLIFRNWKKALIYTTLCLSIFFFFGAFHDTLKGSGLPAFIYSYSFLLPLILGLLVLFAWLTRKAGSVAINRLNIFMQLCLWVIVIPEFIFLFLNYNNESNLVNDFGDPSKKLSANYQPCDTCRKPDIYFIIFDAYTSSACLRQEFNFDNSVIDSFLLGKGFYLASQSSSNYALSPLSISTAFNLNYHQPELAAEKVDGKFIVQSLQTLEKSELPIILQKQGYAFKNFSVFNLEGYPVDKSEHHADFRKNLMHLQTIAGRVHKDLWWNFEKLQSHEKAIAGRQAKVDELLQHSVLSNLAKLKKEIDRKTDSARFVYTHIMLPHDPYFYNEKGERNPPGVVFNIDPDLYIRQLIYTNSIIQELVNNLMQDSREKIIIIAGDHGYREYSDASKMPRIFNNLTACYFPDKNYGGLYDSISPVNLFRVVFNQYFQQQYPLLPDSSIYIKSPGLTFEKRLAQQ